VEAAVAILFVAWAQQLYPCGDAISPLSAPRSPDVLIWRMGLVLVQNRRSSILQRTAGSSPSKQFVAPHRMSWESGEQAFVAVSTNDSYVPNAGFAKLSDGHLCRFAVVLQTV